MNTPVSTMGDTPQRPGIRSDIYIPDQLIAGPLQLVTETITLVGRSVLPTRLRRGTVLGRKTEGVYTVSLKEAKDGAQTPVAILADDVTVDRTPISAGAYLMGEFNQEAMTFDESWDLPSLSCALRMVSIFLKSPVSATDPR